MNWSWRISLEEVLSVPENPLLPTAYEPLFKQCLLFGKKALGCFTSNSMGIWPTYRQTPRKIISSHMSQQQLPVVPCLEGQGCGGGGRARDIASSRGAWWGTPPSRTLQGVGGAQAHFMSPHFLLLGWHWRASVFPHFTQAKGQFCPLNAGASNEWLTGPWMIYNPIALTDWRTPPFKNVKKNISLCSHISEMSVKSHVIYRARWELDEKEEEVRRKEDLRREGKGGTAGLRVMKSPMALPQWDSFLALSWKGKSGEDQGAINSISL